MATKKKFFEEDKEDQLQQQLLINEVNFQHKYWSSSLFNESYILNDLEDKHKEIWHTDSPEFNNFFQRLLNLFNDYRSEEDHMNTWSETETINNWVIDVLDALGWDDNSQGKRRPYLEETSFTDKSKTLRPDILIVDNPDEKKLVKPKKGLGDLREAIRKVIVPVEVKYWNRLKQYQDDQTLDKIRIENKDQDELATTVSPNEQTVRYMDMLKCPWGILTDGAIWRLFHKDLSTDDPSRYYEFNLQTLFRQYLTRETKADNNEILEAAKYFYFFFSKKSISDIATVDKTFCDNILAYSKKYISGVQEDLKERFIDAMNICCNEYFKGSTLEANKENLDFIRNIAESTLFNVLFTKSLESRGVLQLSDKPYYAVSISNIIDCIGGAIDPKFQYDPENPEITNERNLTTSFKNSGKFKFNYESDGTEIHDKIVRLTRIIHDGGGPKANNFGFEIKGFKESVFNNEELEFFKNYKINNESWVKILFQLAFIDSDSSGSYKYKQIPYAYFSPRELGEIYEGFLEWKLAHTKTDLVFKKRQWKEVELNSDEYRNTKLKTAKKGTLYFSPDNKERRDTGSYYTPDYIVNYIVKETLKPLCHGKSSFEIKMLQICDPAMGSGHFLVSALNYITDEYMKALYRESSGNVERTPTEAKRDILNRCIFGVDINPRAVKLAKMSLWLESAHPKAKLERLDDQLTECDSLIEENPWPEYSGISQSGFDAIVGNPPYVSEVRGNKDLFKKYKENELTSEYYESKMDLFYFFICRGLDFIKPGGSICTIIEQYWMTRSNVKRLHKKIYADSTIIENLNFGSNIIFDEAPGVHSTILHLKKDKSPEVNFNCHNVQKYSSHDEVKNWLNNKPKNGKAVISFDEKIGKFVTQTDNVYKSNNFIPSRMIQQGVVTPQDCVLRRHAESDSKLIKGEGVFILTEIELARLKIGKKEQKFIKPFFDAKHCSQFNIEQKNPKYLIYISSKLNKKLQIDKSTFPKITKHLDRFKKIITSSNKPYGLHRSRQEEWFQKGSKIISIRKTKKPCFVWTRTECYMNQSVFIIRTNSEFLDKLLTIILNSERSSNFFKSVKTQGDQLQIDKEVLLRLPLPKFLDVENFIEKEFNKKHPEIVIKIKNFYKKISKKKFDSIGDCNNISDILYNID